MKCRLVGDSKSRRSSTQVCLGCSVLSFAETNKRLRARRQKAQDLKALFRRDGKNRRHEVVQRSALGLLILLSGSFAPVLIMSEPLARAATSVATIGGPFTLSMPDGTTVTDQTYRGKWLLVYFG